MAMKKKLFCLFRSILNLVTKRSCKTFIVSILIYSKLPLSYDKVIWDFLAVPSNLVHGLLSFVLLGRGSSRILRLGG